MKITIEIPKEFEGHWKTDRFKESIERLKADIHFLAGNYEEELADMLIRAFTEATEPDSEKPNCVNCRHADRMPGVYPCSQCNVAYGKPPSKWEAKEE